MEKFKCASFFAGVGGIDLGFEETGAFQTVYANEFDPSPVKTYEANFNIKVDNRDIKEVEPDEIEDFDVMLAGFPCLTGDTLILTDKGYKELIDIKPGENVISFDGTLNKVKGFMMQGIQDVYTIKADGIYDIQATANHRFAVRQYIKNDQLSQIQRLSRATWKKTEQIIPGRDKYDNYYFLGVPVNTESKMPLAPSWLHQYIYDEDLWFIIGKWCKSGTLNDGRLRESVASISCNKKESKYLGPKIIKYFAHSLSKDMPYYTYKINSGIFADFLSQFKNGITKDIIDLPVNLLKAFIDGFTMQKDSDVKIFSEDLKLLMEFSHCVHKVYHAPCHISIIEKTKNRAKYMLTFQKKESNFYEDNYLWFPIISIKPSGTKPVYDVEIEKTNTFIANGCITHNCQAFSIAGYRQGFEDTKGRGELFFELVRILKSKKPRVAFFENVKNLVSHDNGNTFRVICEALTSLGYHYTYQVLNSMTYGNIAQNRERIYIIAFRDKEDYNNFQWPSSIPLTTTVRDIIDFENPVDEKYYYTKGKYKGDIYEKLEMAMADDKKESPAIYQWRRHYVRKNKSNVVPTLTANQGEGGHNVCLIKTDDGRIRKMTPRECFNTQGFPDTFILPSELKDSKLYKQAGNSVCVSVIERIAEEIQKTLISN